MSIYIAGDLKTLSLLTELKGSASAYPCILRQTQRLKREENGYFNLQYTEEFYQAGSQRLFEILRLQVNLAKLTLIQS